MAEKKCLFCTAIEGEYYFDKIWENKYFLAFLDQYPIRKGHVLITPKKHIDYLFDLEEPLYSELFKAAKKIARPLKRAIKCEKVVLGVDGFMVSHVHVHLIPANKGGDLLFIKRKRAGRKELENTAEKIRKEVKRRS